MKKIKKIKIPAQPEKTVEKTLYVCDLCGKESTQNTSFRTCSLCGRLVCRGYDSKCVEYDPEECGDYPDAYCKICYRLTFKKYQKLRTKLREKYEEEQEKLKQKIKKESLREKKK